MRVVFGKSLIVLGALALASCGGATEEEEFPDVVDVGVDDGSSQDLPELEAAEAAKGASAAKAAPASRAASGSTSEDYPAVTDLGVDNGQSHDLPELEEDMPTDDGGSQDDYSAAGPP